MHGAVRISYRFSESWESRTVMLGELIPLRIVAMARTAAEKTAAEIYLGGSLAYGQLVASELYEALRLELSETPRAAASKRGVLAAAMDQCRRSADGKLTGPGRAAALHAVFELLQSAPSLRFDTIPEPPAPRRPVRQFRVIQGGLT
jgi:hypothetical protein